MSTIEEQDTGAGVSTKSVDMQKLIIALLLVIILLGSMAATYFIFFAPGKSSGAEANPEIYSLQLETFTVNMADTDLRRYLRADITLEFYNKKALEEVQLKKARVRDKIITMLNQKSIKDFDSNQKIEKTRQDLVKAINEILSEDSQVKGLYFENFIIQ